MTSQTTETLQEKATITVNEISRDLGVGKIKVYSLLKQGIIPALCVNRRWMVSRTQYMEWSRNFGSQEQKTIQ